MIHRDLLYGLNIYVEILQKYYLPAMLISTYKNINPIANNIIIVSRLYDNTLILICRAYQKLGLGLMG